MAFPDSAVEATGPPAAALEDEAVDDIIRDERTMIDSCYLTRYGGGMRNEGDVVPYNEEDCLCCCGHPTYYY